MPDDIFRLRARPWLIAAFAIGTATAAFFILGLPLLDFVIAGQRTVWDSYRNQPAMHWIMLVAFAQFWSFLPMVFMLAVWRMKVNAAGFHTFSKFGFPRTLAWNEPIQDIRFVRITFWPGVLIQTEQGTYTFPRCEGMGRPGALRKPSLSTQGPIIR